jgi:hypothetical protein
MTGVSESTSCADAAASSTPDLAEHVIATPRAHDVELRRAGIRRLSLFGSVARGDVAQAVTSTLPPSSTLSPAWTYFV